MDKIHVAFGEVAESTEVATTAEQNLGAARKETSSQTTSATTEEAINN
jgi:hypothetical protein